MPNSRSRRKPKASLTASQQHTLLGRVLVIDGVESWRQFISERLDNQRYTPIECCDLPAATKALDKPEMSLGLAGICLDLRFAPKESYDTASGKIPELPRFLDRLRHQFPAVPMLIISDDVEAGRTAANGLNLVGLQAAFISKDEPELTRKVADAIGHVFGKKHSRKQISDLIVVLTLVCGFVFACVAGALVTSLPNANGSVVKAVAYLILVGWAFSLCYLLILRALDLLPPYILKECVTVIVRYWNPLGALKHFKQDRNRDNETK